MKSTQKTAKYSVNERVLCYEPDLTKARVVYDAKILKVEGTDHKKNSKEFHYLVHFQGWSSTWDRYVTEEFLLKVSAQNRELQRKLFVEAEVATSSLKKRNRKKKRKLSEVLNVSVEDEVESKRPKVQSSPSTSSQMSTETEPSCSGSSVKEGNFFRKLF